MKTLPAYLVVLTAAFVALDIAGRIDWAWWLVTLPVLIAVGMHLLAAVLTAATKDKAK